MEDITGIRDDIYSLDAYIQWEIKNLN